MVPQLVIKVNRPFRPGVNFVGGLTTMGVCPTAVVGLHTTPPVSVVDVGATVGVGVGVSETIGVGVSVATGVVVGAVDGVLEHAESAPTTINPITAKYVPRFTSRPFRCDAELSSIPTQ